MIDSKHSINGDSTAPLLQEEDIPRGKPKQSFMDKLRGVTSTTAFQTAISVVVAVVIFLGMVGLVIGASLRENVVSYNVYDLVSVEEISKHLEKLNTIAKEHGGNRDVLDGGYNASVEYVVSQLSRYKDTYSVTIQNFTSTVLELEEPPIFRITSPAPLSFVHGTDFTFHPSGENAVEGPIADAGNGCSSDLYTNSTIATVTEDGCSVKEKISAASE